VFLAAVTEVSACAALGSYASRSQIEFIRGFQKRCGLTRKKSFGCRTRSRTCSSPAKKWNSWDDRDTIRQQVVQILTATLKEEEKIELEVRKRTSRIRRKSSKAARSGTSSTKVLQDELRRMGIAAAPDDRHRS